MAKLLTFAAFSFILLACLPGMAGQPQPQKISLQDVLKNPSQFDGKLIQVSGFLVQEFENSGLYPDKERPLGRGIWVNTSTEMSEQRDRLRNHFVVLTGVFDASRHGHLGWFKGTLTVSKCELVRDDAPSSPGKEGKK